MNLNEIRPSDFVFIGDTRTEWRPEFYFRWDASGRIPIGYAEGNNTNPIPITKDFLKANRFTKFDENTYILYSSLDIREVQVFISKTNYPSVLDLDIYIYSPEDDRFNLVFSKEIKYVHQLQHAFTESELEDKLILDI